MLQSSSLKCSVLALALFGAVLLMCRKDPLHGQVAPEREWSPPRPGAVEQTMRKILPPAQTPKSPPPIEPEPLIQVDLLLPPEPTSLNLNNKADDENKIPLPSLLPPPPPMPVEPIVQPAREVPELSTTIPQSGEVTMKGIQFAISAILGAAIVAAPAVAQEPKDDVNKTVERLEASIRKLESIEKNLTEYKTSNSAAVSQVQNDLEAVKARLRQIDEDIKALRQIASNTASTSKRDTTTDVAPKTGRVKLSNDYIEEMWVTVNGTAYQLLPGQSRTIKVPPGVFTYQVLQLQRNVQERTIAADEEKPIRIFTQQ